MDDQRKQDHLDDIDKILEDVRNHLSRRDTERGEQFELLALQLLLRVTKAMHSERDVRTLMALVLDSALSFAEAERAFLLLIGEDNAPRFKMGRSYNGDYLTEADVTISSSIVRDTLATLEPLILADAQHNEDYKGRQSIRDLQLRTVMAAPLLHQEDVLGLLYVDSKRPLSRYSKHHLNVLTSLADQAAVAIYNARKFETFTG
ncbi:MAG: GAF domain-containing protein [Anaerolineae bacterium]|nr:GAF domain-containing protein [Anaerolineae bacterium]